jgi:hypothetical protein
MPLLKFILIVYIKKYEKVVLYTALLVAHYFFGDRFIIFCYFN